MRGRAHTTSGSVVKNVVAETMTIISLGSWEMTYMATAITTQRLESKIDINRQLRTLYCEEQDSQ